LDGHDNNVNLASKFDYNKVVIVGVALNSNTPEHTSVYVPNSNIIFHRYT